MRACGPPVRPPFACSILFGPFGSSPCWNGFIDDVTTKYAAGFIRENKDQPFRPKPWEKVAYMVPRLVIRTPACLGFRA